MLSKYWSVEAELIFWTAWNAAMICTPDHWPLISICHGCKVSLYAKLELFRYIYVGNTVIQVLMQWLDSW